MKQSFRQFLQVWSRDTQVSQELEALVEFNYLARVIRVNKHEFHAYLPYDSHLELNIILSNKDCGFIFNHDKTREIFKEIIA